MMRYARFRTARLLAFGGLIVLLAVVAAACGEDEKPTLKLTEWNWPSQDMLTQVLDDVITNEFGYTVERVQLSVDATWPAMCTGDADIVTETWFPARKEQIAEFAAQGCVEQANPVFNQGVQGWFVPRYVIEGDASRGIQAAAPGLRRMDHLNDYWELFRHPEKSGVGEIAGTNAEFVTASENNSRIKGYDLRFEQTNQVEGILLARVKAAYDKGDPVLFMMYRPHWIFADLDLVQIEEPAPFTDGCFKEIYAGDLEDDPGYQCGIPTGTTWTIVSTKLQERAPEVYEFLKLFESPVAEVEKALGLINEGKTIQEAATAWQEENRSKIDAWVKAAKK